MFANPNVCHKVNVNEVGESFVLFAYEKYVNNVIQNVMKNYSMTANRIVSQKKFQMLICHTVALPGSEVWVSTEHRGSGGQIHPAETR